LRRLHDREVSGFDTVEDAASVDTDLTIGFREVCAIAHQTADLYVLSPGINRWNSVVRRKLNQLDTPSVEGRAGTDEESLVVLSVESRESAIDLGRIACFQNSDLQVQVARHRFHISERGIRLGIGGIDQDGDTCCCGNQ